jgi:multiple sugar transport system substrate-binding protein
MASLVSRRQAIGGASLAALGGVIGLAATGCGAGASEAPAPAKALSGKVRFTMPPDATYTGPMNKVKEVFQQRNPAVQISLEPSPDWADNAKLVAAAVAGDAADIAWTTEQLVTPLYVKDIIQPLDDYASKDRQFKSADFFDTVVAAYKFRNKQVGLPLLWGAYVMHYNKTMFDRAGQKAPDDTWTWDTFLQVSRALTKPSTDSNVMGEYGFETRNHQNVWASWIWNNGGDLFSADGLKCVMDSAETTEGMQYVVDLMHRWKVAPTAKELADRNLGTNGFGLTGKIGMVFNAIYFLPTYRKVDLFEWDVAPIPKGKKGRATTNPTSGLAMWKGTRNPDATWAFMRHLISEESERTYVTEGINGMPVNKAAAQLILQDSRPPKNKQLYFDAFKDAKPAFTSPYGNTAIGVINTQLKAAWDNAEPVKGVLGNAVPLANRAMQDEIAADTKK